MFEPNNLTVESSVFMFSVQTLHALPLHFESVEGTGLFSECSIACVEGHGNLMLVPESLQPLVRSLLNWHCCISCVC